LMGLTGATGRISLKVQSAAAWNTAVGPNFSQPSVQGLFWELSTDSGGSYSVRSEQYDHGTLNIPARVGYLYPLTDRNKCTLPTTIPTLSPSSPCPLERLAETLRLESMSSGTAPQRRPS
jgi:hypothetical protein